MYTSMGSLLSVFGCISLAFGRGFTLVLGALYCTCLSLYDLGSSLVFIGTPATPLRTARSGEFYIIVACILSLCVLVPAVVPSPAALVTLFGVYFTERCIFGLLFILHLWRIFALLKRYVLAIIGCIASSQSTVVFRYIISIGFIISSIGWLICSIMWMLFSVMWVVCSIIQSIYISATVWHIALHRLGSSLGLSVAFSASLAAFVALYLALYLFACGDGFYFKVFFAHIRASHIRTSAIGQIIAVSSFKVIMVKDPHIAPEQWDYINVITEKGASSASN